MRLTFLAHNFMEIQDIWLQLLWFFSNTADSLSIDRHAAGNSASVKYARANINVARFLRHKIGVRFVWDRYLYMYRIKINCLSLAGWLSAATLLLLAGCASAPQKAETRLLWPPPPQEARIEFIRSISNEDAVGRDTTFSESVANFLGGAKPKQGQLVMPMGIAVSDDNQRLYVSDFAQAAVFIFDFGNKKFQAIGNLHRPTGVALDGDENLYVAEQELKGVSVFDRNGKKLRFITDDSIQRPTGVAVDRKLKRLYVVDTGHTKSTIQNVKIFDLQGKLIGQIGNEKGGNPGEFLFPTYVTVDGDSNVYVTDTLNSRVQKFDSSGKYLRSFGQRGNGWGMFDKPKGVALDSFGNVYVADSGWSNVQIFNQQGQILLFFGGRGPIPGMLKNATAVAISPQNYIYVGDYINHRVEEYRLVNTKGSDSFEASQGQGAGKPDNAGSITAEENSPPSPATGGGGN
jgi:DNA-binding beta-propeller fold protein YncE